MALYDGFFDAEVNEKTGEYDRAYGSVDFASYFEHIIGSGVCINDNPDSFKAEFENDKLYLRMGYLFIRGYWLANVPRPDEDPTTFKGYEVTLPDNGIYAVVAHLNLGNKIIEIQTRPVSQAYPDSLVLAIVSPTSAEDTRRNTDICGIIETAGDMSSKVEWAINYIDNEIESKLAAVEQDIAAQSRKLDAKIAEVQAVADGIVPPPVGSIKFSASQNAGEGWLRCDGSFVSETEYPELVTALGKLTPSGDKFQLISSGEIGPQISNGVVYGGRLWVYSYSTKKLYGIDVEGEGAVKEISMTSEDPTFSDFIAPSTARPLVLSIVPHKIGTGAKIFLTQIIKEGGKNGNLEFSDWKTFFLIFTAEFSISDININMEAPFSTIPAYTTSTSPLYNTRFDASVAVPTVISQASDGEERYSCALGTVSAYISGLNPQTNFMFGFLCWAGNSGDAEVLFATQFDYNSTAGFKKQRIAFSPKNHDEAVWVLSSQGKATGYWGYHSYSKNNELFNFSSGEFRFTGTPSSGRNNACPINIAGSNFLIFAYDKGKISYVSTANPLIGLTEISGLPSSSRVFVDAAAYLWGKDIYMIFVGTGIIFSRTLEEGSFGYLDTTSVLGTITQFGYLDYSQDEGTLYILGQDTTNTVKAAKIVLNTLYDYANDGAWLPMIASDGVPAYIKAKEGA